MPIRLSRLFSPLLFLLLAPVAQCLTRAAEQDSSEPAAASGNVYADTSSFAAELHRIGNTIKEGRASAANLTELRKNLPDQWELTTTERKYSLSAEPLRALLRDTEKETKPESRAAKATEAADWAFDLANQVTSYASAPTHSVPRARTALERILSRREFGSVHGPTSMDLFRQRVGQWIARQLERFFRQIGRYPIGARVLFWAIVIAVVVWLALTLFRYWTRRARLEELQAPESVAYMRAWQEWIRIAREAATRGDFREAIHSAYWAGISYLEDSGVVRKDRARTPREYMRAVSSATQLVVTGRSTREALSGLTMALEQVWYGRRPASIHDFEKAMRSVEALGCQLQQ